MFTHKPPSNEGLMNLYADIFEKMQLCNDSTLLQKFQNKLARFFKKHHLDFEELSRVFEKRCDHLGLRTRKGYREQARILLEEYQISKKALHTILKELDLLAATVSSKQVVTIPVIRQEPYTVNELAELSIQERFHKHVGCYAVGQNEMRHCNFNQENPDLYPLLIAPDVTACSCILLKDLNSNHYWMLHADDPKRYTEHGQSYPLIEKIMQSEELIARMELQFLCINHIHQAAFEIEKTLLSKGINIVDQVVLDEYFATPLNMHHQKNIFFSMKDGFVTILDKVTGFAQSIEIISFIPKQNEIPRPEM